MWFRIKNLTLSLILASAAVLGRPDCAYACSCAPVGSPQQELAAAAAVFAGRVIQVEVPPSVGGIVSSADPVKVTFEVFEVWKGPVEPFIQIVTARNGASCGYQFLANTDYLVYARTVEGRLYAGLCSRILTYWPGAGDSERLGEGQVPPTPVPTVDASQVGDSPELLARYTPGVFLLAGTLSGVGIGWLIWGRRRSRGETAA